MANTDFWKIYGFATTADQGEMVFQVGDNGQPYASGGERFRFNYDNSGGGTGAKDVFIVDYDLSYFNTSLGINTDTPTAAFDVHSNVNVIAQLNQTVATNNSLLAFQNANNGLWRIGNFYNGGANDFGVFDVIGAIQPVTIKKTTGQVLIGTSTVGSGKLVVASATGDNGVQIVGASAPSLRIDNAESGPTKRAGLGISTATNNFIQGSADRDFCMFNGSTTASPILFGIYDTTNVAEAARISAARNFLIGTTTDAGQKLQVNGTSAFSGTVNLNAYGNQLKIGSNGGTDGFIGIGSGQSSLFIGDFATGTKGLTINTLTGAATFSNIVTATEQFIGNNSISNPTVGITNATVYALNGPSNNNTFGIGVGAIRSGNYDMWFQTGATNGGGFRFYKGVTELVTIATTGNLLIGTTTDAGEKLQVAGETAITNSGGVQLNLVFSGATKTTFRCDSAGGLLLNTAGNYIINYIAGVERLRIKTNTINISSIPTSSSGLSSGDLWSNLGIINIVP
jgi:hypothetical protein